MEAEHNPGLPIPAAHDHTLPVQVLDLELDQLDQLADQVPWSEEAKEGLKEDRGQCLEVALRLMEGVLGFKTGQCLEVHREVVLADRCLEIKRAERSQEPVASAVQLLQTMLTRLRIRSLTMLKQATLPRQTRMTNALMTTQPPVGTKSFKQKVSSKAQLLLVIKLQTQPLKPHRRM